MRMMASQITVVSVVFSTLCSGADQRKHQRSTPLAFVRGIRLTGGFPSQRASNAENIFIWWRHHAWRQVPMYHLWSIPWLLLTYGARSQGIIGHSIGHLFPEHSSLDTRLCFYQMVLTDSPRIILCLIPFFPLSNRISAIFNPKRWSQWDQRWTTSKGVLSLDPIRIKGYFGYTIVYFTHKMTK